MAYPVHSILRLAEMCCVCVCIGGQNDLSSAKMRRRLIGRIVLVSSQHVPSKCGVQRTTGRGPDTSGFVWCTKNNWSRRQEEEEIHFEVE